MQAHNVSLARESDLPFLNGIELSAAAIFPRGALPDIVRTEAVPAETLAAAMLAGRLFVCRNDCGQPVGYAFWQEYGNSALLAQIDVLPQYGRCGRGKALVERIIADVAGAGLRDLYLTTFENIPWNAPFYQKIGFRITERDEQPRFIRDILLGELERGMKNRVAMVIGCNM